MRYSEYIQDHLSFDPKLARDFYEANEAFIKHILKRNEPMLNKLLYWVEEALRDGRWNRAIESDTKIKPLIMELYVGMVSIGIHSGFGWAIGCLSSSTTNASQLVDRLYSHMQLELNDIFSDFSHVAVRNLIPDLLGLLRSEVRSNTLTQTLIDKAKSKVVNYVTSKNCLAIFYGYSVGVLTLKFLLEQVLVTEKFISDV